MRKICSCCKKDLDIKLFNFRNKDKGERHSYCAECGKLKTRKHYQENKQYYISKAKKNNAIYIKKVHDNILYYLNKHPCVDCNESDPVILEFDHREKKVAAIATLVSQHKSWEKIKEEIVKCDVRCVACHRRKTAKQYKYYRFLNAPVA